MGEGPRPNVNPSKNMEAISEDEGNADWFHSRSLPLFSRVVNLSEFFPIDFSVNNPIWEALLLTYPIAHYVVAKPLLHVIIMWLCNQTKDDMSNCIELTSFLGSCKKRQVSFCNDIVRLVTIASQTFCKCHAQRHDQQKEEITNNLGLKQVSNLL